MLESICVALVGISKLFVMQDRLSGAATPLDSVGYCFVGNVISFYKLTHIAGSAGHLGNEIQMQLTNIIQILRIL